MPEQSFNKSDNEITLRLNAVIETAIDGIITIDKRGIVESINSAACRLFGYDASEVIGHNIRMLMPSPDREAHDGYLERYQTTRQPRIIGIGREVKGLRSNGETFPMRLAVSEVQLPTKTIYTGIIHDLSAQKKAESQIIKLNEQLETKVKERTDELAKTVNKLLDTNQQLEHEVKERKAAEKALMNSLEKEKELSEMKSRFVSTASHQFRTPLSSILSSAELIDSYRSRGKVEKMEKHTARIISAVTHLIQVLNDFLSLSQLEEGKHKLQNVSFVLEDFCMEIRGETEGLLKADQKIKHYANQPGAIVSLDKKILKDILFNLLSNAIKYSDPGTIVQCNTLIQDKQLVIEVVDQGIGIPKEDQPHLFTRFFRAHNAENIQGTGLGLNIVRHYVELMHGEIEFESNLGKGSTFRVILPIDN